MISVWELRPMTDAGLVFLLQFLFFFFSFTFHDLVCVWFRLSKDMKDWWTEAVGMRVMVVSMVSVYLSVVVSAWRWIILYFFFFSGTCLLVNLSCGNMCVFYLAHLYSVFLGLFYL